MKKTVIILAPFLVLSLAGCTNGKSDEAIKKEILSVESSKEKFGDYYEVGAYKVLDTAKPADGIIEVKAEQAVKLVKDCKTSVKSDDDTGLVFCGQEGLYEKKEFKSGKEIKINYFIVLEKKSSGDYGLRRKKVSSDIYK